MTFHHLISSHPGWRLAGGTSGSDRTMERLGSRQMTKSSTWSRNGNGDVLGEGVGNFSLPREQGDFFFDVKIWCFHHDFIWVFSTWIWFVFGRVIFGLGSYGITIFPAAFWFFHSHRKGQDEFPWEIIVALPSCFLFNPPRNLFLHSQTPKKRLSQETHKKHPSFSFGGVCVCLCVFDMFPLFSVSKLRIFHVFSRWLHAGRFPPP